MRMQETVSPVDGRIYASRPYATAKEIQTALVQSENAYRVWSKTSIESRAKLCRLFVEKMLDNRETITRDLSWQMGRPILYACSELNSLEERARYMIDIAPTALREIYSPSQPQLTRFIRRQPLGVVFVIAAWNFPYLIPVNSVIPSIMAGNTVILKHSAQTQLCAEHFLSAFRAAGLPEHVFQILNLDHEQVDEVLQNSLIKHVVFTGSVEGGHSIQKSLSSSFASSGLELGGKDPAYVASDADIEYSVSQLVDGAYFNSGQSCCGIERIYVHRSLYDRFLEAFVHQVERYKLGNPLDQATTLGPMVRTEAAERIRQSIEEAVSQGAKPLINPKCFPEARADSPYLAPEVLVQVTHDMKLMKEETFGPTVGIMAVSDDREALELMNDSGYGLTASIWTRDQERAIQIGNQVDTGTWFMNRCDYLDPSLAWVGVKNSGRGATLSKVGYECLTRPQSFYLKKTDMT